MQKKMLIANTLRSLAATSPKVEVSGQSRCQSQRQWKHAARTDTHTHMHSRASWIRSSWLVFVLTSQMCVGVIIVWLRRTHCPCLWLCCCLFFLFLCCPVRCESKRVAIIVASQAVISPCPCRICRRCFSPTVSWLAVCSMKLVTSIFVVDVVVVIGRLDCAGARPNHLLLPSSSSPCCSTPLCGLPACPLALLPSCLRPVPMHSACGRTVYEQLLGTWHSTAQQKAHASPWNGRHAVASLSSARSAVCCPILSPLSSAPV